MFFRHPPPQLPCVLITGYNVMIFRVELLYSAPLLCPQARLPSFDTRPSSRRCPQAPPCPSSALPWGLPPQSSPGRTTIGLFSPPTGKHHLSHQISFPLTGKSPKPGRSHQYVTKRPVHLSQSSFFCCRTSVGSFRTSLGEVVSHVNLSDVTVREGGIYTCTAHNAHGSQSHSARINVYGRSAMHLE